MDCGKELKLMVFFKLFSFKKMINLVYLIINSNGGVLVGDKENIGL